MLTPQQGVRLAAGTRLRHDTARGRWVLLGPERMLLLDDIARLIVERCDGQSIATLSQQLAAEFDAPPAQIEHDVLALLTTLCDKGFMRHD